jgi:hypothetical protein
MPQEVWTIINAVITGLFSLTAAYIAFKAARNITISEKKIQTKVELLNRLEDKIFKISKYMSDIGNNIGLDYMSTKLKTSYTYTESYHRSKEELGAYIRIYFPTLNDIYTKYDWIIFELNKLHLEKPKPIEKIDQKYEEFVFIQSEFFQQLTKETQKLKNEVNLLLK